MYILGWVHSRYNVCFGIIYFTELSFVRTCRAV